MDTTPQISEGSVIEIMESVAFKYHNLTEYQLSIPELKIFNEGLFKDDLEETFLVWEILLEGNLDSNQVPVKERYFIDAYLGAVIFHVSEIHQVLDRKIYDASVGLLPGTLLRVEGGPATGNADADNAYNYAGDVYAYYNSVHGRDSIDGAGMPMEISVFYPQ